MQPDGPDEPDRRERPNRPDRPVRVKLWSLDKVGREARTKELGEALEEDIDGRRSD